MEIKKLSLGNTSVKNNIFIAPMAGYTDYGFRKLEIMNGAGLTFTELVSAKGLMYGGNGSKELLYSEGDYKNTACQLFGSDPYYMRSAMESEYLKDFEIVDINMGCPVPKVFNNGEGSALLTDIKKAETLLKECVKSGKIVTIKIRTGLKKGDDIASDYAMMAENAGAKLVTIHGRVREDYYSGEPDFDAIYKAKKSVSIPIIANGGIFTKKDADDMIDKTGADGVMLARGAVANPFLVCELLDIKPQMTLKEFMISHIEIMRKLIPDRTLAMEFRKFTPYYFKGMKNMKDVKIKINNCDSTEKIIEIIKENL